MAKLYFRYGAMGSSKTANAIMVQYNYRERGQNALLLKPGLEQRDGENTVGSRSGLSAPCRYVEDLDRIDVTRYDCIIVDECQFMTKKQVELLVHIADDLNIPVICYGLRADFRGELFEGSKWLLAWADTIEEIKTVCWCGRKATCNARIVNGKVATEGAQIVLGGNESYVALCRKHWRRGELAPEEIRQIRSEKEEFLSLLLDADPEKEALDRYLDASEMYVMYRSGIPVGEICLWIRPDGQPEIKNLATAPEARNTGVASGLIRYVTELLRGRYPRLWLGTSPANIAFYEHRGVRKAGIEKDFFVTNYKEPIIEDGVRLTDMHMLAMDLKQDSEGTP